MDATQLFTILPVLNLLGLLALGIYLPLKTEITASVIFFILSCASLILFQLGSLLFISFPLTGQGVLLVLIGLASLPLTLTLISQTLARQPRNKISLQWAAYYAVQLLIFGLFFTEIISGRVIDWVTGILDQPIILIEKSRRWFFLNTLIACGVALLCFEGTLRSASKPQQEKLKYIFVGYMGLIFYFAYLSSHIVLSSYLSRNLLLSGSALMSASILLILYSLIRYPVWQLEIFISRRFVLGCLSFSALFLYLIVSGWLIGLLDLAQSKEYAIALPALVFSLTALLLSLYLSTTFKQKVQAFITRNFFSHRYDYRDLWMRFSERTSGSLNLNDILPKIAELIADSMYVRQVAVWLASTADDTFCLAYSHNDPNPAAPKRELSLRWDPRYPSPPAGDVLTVPESEGGIAHKNFPLLDLKTLKELQLSHIVPVRKGGEILGWLAVGRQVEGRRLSLEDEQLLVSISSQLAHQIQMYRLSEQILEARQWESFHRFTSFVIHDLKNLATQQSMVLENSKNLRGNWEFVQDAFATFARTTDKMIHLIANLSVQKDVLTPQKGPVNVADLLTSTFEDLKIGQRTGVRLVTEIPPETSQLTVSGESNLLRKVFTNILLNALQSLPNGEGTVQVAVSHPNGKIVTSVTDTGCGIKPEIMRNIFRPFQTTKKGGMGIGLCHTRSIVEAHGGRIRIESEVNRGTKVEIELPRR